MTILYYILLPKTCIVIMNEITKLCKTVLTQIITLIKLTLDLCSSRTDGKIMFEVYHRGARKKKPSNALLLKIKGAPLLKIERALLNSH